MNQINAETAGQVNIETCHIETMNVYAGKGIMTELEALRQEIKRMRREFRAVEKERDLEIAALTAEIIRLREKAGEGRDKDCKQILFNIGKWNVQRGKDGYYRMFRRHRGRVHGVYLGKYPSPETAQAKAMAKDRELGMGENHS